MAQTSGTDQPSWELMIGTVIVTEALTGAGALSSPTAC